MTKSKHAVEPTEPEDTRAEGDPQVVPADEAPADEAPADDLDVEPSVASEPTPVAGPADDVTPVDPSRPVGNWGVYPSSDTDAAPARDTEE